MSTFPSMPLFTDAFIADTGHLSAQETGAYFMLLMMAWRSPGCRLPDNDDKLARWARVDRRTWLRIKPTVMEFWTLAEGFWTQKRLSKEHGVVSKRAEVARDNGKHGGRPKSLEKQEVADPVGSAQATQPKAPNPNPISKGSEDKSSAETGPPEIDPERELFVRGKQVLGPSSGGLIAKALRVKGGSVPLARALIEVASTKDDPREFVGRAVSSRPPDQGERQHGFQRWAI